jgi:hypothetical protein
MHRQVANTGGRELVAADKLAFLERLWADLSPGYDAAEDMAKVKEGLGYGNVSATRICDRRKSRPEDSPSFRVKY